MDLLKQILTRGTMLSEETLFAAAPDRKRMPAAIRGYVRVVDKIGKAAGVVAMFLTFVLLAILIESSAARLFFGVSHIWSVEVAMFTMSAYYLLGGALSEQDDYHVRMDLFYNRFSPRTKAIMDSITGLLVIFYLVFLFTGAVSNTHWAWTNKQVNFSAWAPPMTPIKLIMTVGVLLMLLQVIATFFRDLSKALERSLE